MTIEQERDYSPPISLTAFFGGLPLGFLPAVATAPRLVLETAPLLVLEAALFVLEAVALFTVRFAADFLATLRVVFLTGFLTAFLVVLLVLPAAALLVDLRPRVAFRALGAADLVVAFLRRTAGFFFAVEVADLVVLRPLAAAGFLRVFIRFSLWYDNYCKSNTSF